MHCKGNCCINNSVQLIKFLYCFSIPLGEGGTYFTYFKIGSLCLEPAIDRYKNNID